MTSRTIVTMKQLSLRFTGVITIEESGVITIEESDFQDQCLAEITSNLIALGESEVAESARLSKLALQ